MSSFQEIELGILEDMREHRRLLDGGIRNLELSLSQPPYVSNLDYEEIRLMAEHDIVWFDQLEQERDKEATNGK